MGRASNLKVATYGRKAQQKQAGTNDKVTQPIERVGRCNWGGSRGHCPGAFCARAAVSGFASRKHSG
jgi:hypothetical protein